jgi:hypothetical protein
VDNLVNKTIFILAIALTMMVAPAGASLTSTSFGFPTIVQTGSTTAFVQDTANAQDFEDVSISFPIAADSALAFGPVSLAFPSISQTSLQTQSITHTEFSQTNEFAEFAYPFVGVGTTVLPGLGFGF